MKTKSEMETTHGFKALGTRSTNETPLRPMRRIGRERKTKRAQDALQKFSRMLR